MNMKRKIIVAVTGASGAIYARLLMETLSRLEEQVAEAAVMLSANAARIWEYELEKAFSSSYSQIRAALAESITAASATCSSSRDRVSMSRRA